MTTTPPASNDAGTSATPPSRIDSAREKVTTAAGSARDATAEAYAAAREKVGTAVSGASTRVVQAAETTREAASDAGRKAAEGVQDNPVAALVGGLVLGAIAAALLPRTEREVAAFGALGTRLNGAARDAAVAAKTAGRNKLDELGLTGDRAQETVSKLFTDVARAATEAGKATATAPRDVRHGEL